MFKNKPIIFAFIPLFILFFAQVAFAQDDIDSNDKPSGNVHSDQTILQNSLKNELLQSEPSQEQKQQEEDNSGRVIAHQSIKDNALSLNDLRAIFSLRARKWPDGTPITVFVLRDEAEVHRQFLLKTLKMLPHQLRRQWDRFIYSGIGQGPTVVDSQEEMLLKVKATPGGIGYLEEGVSDDSVQMLSIR